MYPPEGVYSAEDRRALASAIVPLYPVLPKFYVGMVFHAMADSTFFIGGRAVDDFMRISVDHIARQFSDERVRERWLAMVTKALGPFTSDRGLDWELHADETPFHLWLIQGMRPPLPDSPREALWIEQNRPVPAA